MESTTEKALHHAYGRTKPKHTGRTQNINEKFDRLLALGKSNESSLLKSFKPAIVLALKWRFDYLCRTLESPFEMEADLDYWIRTLETLQELSGLGWYSKGVPTTALDPWDRTAQGFDLGWTTTTEGERFEQSKKIAEERLSQIYSMLGGANYFEGKTILDSGCGPGRYIWEVLKQSPAKIVGMDQGERLVKVLTERFANEPKVKIEKGTCTKLTYSDESFDFVFSNGVLHHTRADLQTMIKDHWRVLKPGGAMFIMLVGKGGMELKLWEFVRGFIYDIPMDEMLRALDGKINHLRLQGVVDHMYGEYQQTGREQFEEWVKPLFRKVERVAGVAGLDVTPEIYEHDPYLEARFGCGHLRYLLHK